MNSQTVAEERRRLIEERLRHVGSVAISELETEFGTSAVTIRRDLSLLEERGRALRTHGGAILPTLARHEESYQYRLEQNRDAKERLARAAVAMLEPGEVVFMDSSTTSYYVVRRMVEARFTGTVITNLVPSMELIGTLDTPDLDVIGIGGNLRKLTLSFVGPQAMSTVESHFADKCILSVKGVTQDDHLTDPHSLETEVKRAMVARSETSLLLVDGTKFDERGMNVLSHVSEIQHVLVADGDPERIRRLEDVGVDVREVRRTGER